MSLLATMLVTVPAGFAARLSTVTPPTPVTGTIWSGATALPGGNRLAWRADPFASLASMSFVANVTVDGPETALTGRLSLRGAHARLTRVDGRFGWSLLQTLLPDLNLDCDIGLRLETADIRVTARAVSIAGSATTEAGACRSAGSHMPFNVPATRIAAEARDGATFASAALAADPSVTLVQASTTRAGDISLTLMPAALDLQPGPPASGPIVYEVRMR